MIGKGSNAFACGNKFLRFPYDSKHATNTAPIRLQCIFLVRSGHSVKSDSVPICTETVFIFQEILRAKSDAGALMQFDCRPMALPY
jgi:hypothetical protein